jgi:hypothetical protein
MAKIYLPDDTFWRDKRGGIVGQLGFQNSLNSAAIAATQTQSIAKGQAQIACGVVAGAWHALSVASQDLWRDFSVAWPLTSKYGSSIEIGGWQWFCKFNIPLYSKRNTLITVPPADPTSDYPATFSISLNGLSGDLELDLNALPIDEEFVIVQRMLNVPESAVRRRSYLKSFTTFTVESATPLVIAQASEIDLSKGRQKFKFSAFDSQGRLGNLVFDDYLIPTF